jgi:hypothetical protein
VTGATPRPRGIEDDEVLTHYGIDMAFRTTPRWRIEASMSLILGRLTGEEAGNRVLKRAIGDGHDSARYTTAGKLRRAGFVVEHTPHVKNPDHVSVRREGSWDDEPFDGCFNDAAD